MLFRNHASVVTLGAAISCAAPVLGAQPAPEPGGANQTHGVAGTLASTLFNGQTRLRKMSLGKPDGSVNESYADSATTKWLAFRGLMSNGTARVLTMMQLSASMVDADGIAVAAQPDKVRPMGAVTDMPPGGAWKETVFFAVPVDFKPVKIVLVPADMHYKAFRITLRPSDLPPS